MIIIGGTTSDGAKGHHPFGGGEIYYILNMYNIQSLHITCIYYNLHLNKPLVVNNLQIYIDTCDN